MRLLIEIPDEYYNAIKAIPDIQCTADMLIIKNGIPQETVTEFADRCRECGARYGKLLKQEPKIGHWIFKQFDEETGISNNYWCSKCDKPLAQVYKTYCSNCGTKMQEETKPETNDIPIDEKELKLKRYIEKDIEMLNEIIESGWLISDLEKCPAIDACEDAITALKQYPVLDKVRAEIEERKLNSGGEPNRELAFNVCLKIIDKYRGNVDEI